MYARGSRAIPELLVAIADKVARNAPLTIDERAFLDQLLLALAEGRDVREELRIDAAKVGHNPPQTALNAEIVRELRRCVADGQRTPKGQPSTAAVAAVGRITGKTPEAVRSIWRRATATTKAKDPGQ